jgi:dTDP-4-dehydrorhamnose 3,5-epimerase
VRKISAGFEGLWILEPEVREDSRGLFFESYNRSSFEALGLAMNFVQDNQSWSRAGVIRGLHFQIPPVPQTKLVRVLQGSIWDVVVDLRRDQPTYRKIFYAELTAANKRQLLVPNGFAHGFSVISDSAEVLYKSDGLYTPSLERGIRYDDPDLHIEWKIAPGHQPLVSGKDLAWPRLSEIPGYF